jgi:hypothetical protein
MPDNNTTNFIHTITAQEVQGYSEEHLCNELEASDREGLWPLMSPKQHLFLLGCPSSVEFNRQHVMKHESTGKEVAKKLREYCGQVIDSLAMQSAISNFNKFKKYNTHEFITLQKTKVWDYINEKRQQTSYAIKEDQKINSTRAQDGLKIAEERFLTYDFHSKPIDLNFLDILNQTVLSITPGLQPCNPDDLSFRYELSGLREHAVIEQSDLTLVYLEGAALKEEFNYFIDWFNNIFASCSKEEYNPIVFAASTFQRFVSIHPFNNGNGRTGRLLCDMVLRNFNLLPTIWENVNMAIFPCKQMAVTSTEAVQTLIKGLNDVYTIIDCHNSTTTE